MRLLILTVGDHLYANQIVTHLLRTRQVVAVWESGVLFHGKSYLAALGRYWRVSGPDYVISQAIKQWIFKLGSHLASALRRGQPGDVLFSYKRLASAAGVPVYVVRDINGGEAHSRLRQASPDLVVSVYFNQILAPETIAIAPLGCVNGHPAPLPRYRGVSPVFWVLANGEFEAGFTVHKIDAGIDTGGILAQSTVSIAPDDTEHSLYWRLTKDGIALLDEALDRIEGGEKPPEVTLDSIPSYFSIPTREAVRRFRQRGRRFFRYSELFRPE